MTTSMTNQKLYKAATILAIIVLSVIILVYAKSFLVPIAFGGVLAMLLVPVARLLQRKGVGKGVSILISILLLLGFFALTIFFVSWQAGDIIDNAGKIEQQLTKKIQEAKQVITEQFGVSQATQNKMIKEQQEASSTKASSVVMGFLAGVTNVMTNALLITVYVFLFLYFGGRIKEFITKLVPTSSERNAGVIMNEAQQVSQRYLGGLFLMIACLWVMYGIGFSILGIKNALFFAVLCGLLEIVPFVGNITGTALTLAFAMVDGGDTTILIGILVTYGLVQFIQTYLLEPLVVGAEVNINPLFTILAIVAGEALWGIPGMVLAIPLLGMIKIVCDHITPLKPFGYLIGQSKKDQNSGMVDKIKGLFGKKQTSAEK